MRQGRPLPTFPFNTEFLARAIKPEKEIRNIQIGKQEVKLSLFTDNTVLNVENSKDFICKKKRKILSSKFCKVAGHKINTQKSVLFHYTTKKQPKKEENNFTYNRIKEQNTEKSV